jgi:hypothetical protein
MDAIVNVRDRGRCILGMAGSAGEQQRQSQTRYTTDFLHIYFNSLRMIFNNPGDEILSKYPNRFWVPGPPFRTNSEVFVCGFLPILV